MNSLGRSASARPQTGAPARRRWRPVDIARLLIALAVAAVVAATPEFFTPLSLIATLDLAALVGLVALGMSFITLSGNIMSLALAASMAASSMAFLALLPYGFAAASAAAFALGVAVNAAQGAVIGVFRANALIVSIAALALITGLVTALTTGASVLVPDGMSMAAYRFQLGLIEAPTIVFFVCAVIAQCLLSYTRFGRELLLTGSNMRAAEAAGIRVARVVTGVYGVAGAFAAIAGIVAGTRFESASLETAHAYDYDAIAAVLIGGTLVSGGQGSAWQTVIGTLVYASLTTLLTLGGYSQEAQRLLTGGLILAVMCLHAAGER
jgi:ribose/xylose/arabinose/galactoside ABC-type transport system permease subunit